MEVYTTTDLSPRAYQATEHQDGFTKGQVYAGLFVPETNQLAFAFDDRGEERILSEHQTKFFVEDFEVDEDDVQALVELEEYANASQHGPSEAI